MNGHELAPVEPMQQHRPAHLYPVEAERAAIGLALSRGCRAMTVLRSMVRTADFGDPRCVAAYVALVDIEAGGELPADDGLPLAALLAAMRSNGDGQCFRTVEDVHSYFLHDEPAFGGVEGVKIAARLIAKGAQLRLALEQTERMARALRTQPELADDDKGRAFLDKAGRTISELASRTVTDGGAMSIAVVCDEHDRVMLDRLDGSAAVVDYGIRTLDDLTEGINSDQCETVVLAARPSMGKTALMQAIARSQNVEFMEGGRPFRNDPHHWSEIWRPRDDPAPILIASAEQGEVGLIDRLAADMVTVNNRRVQRPIRHRDPRWAAYDRERWQSLGPLLADAKRFVRTWPISFVRRPKILEEIERQARAWRASHPVIGKYADGTDRRPAAAFMVDHLGEINMLGGKPKGTSEVEYRGEIAKRLRDLGDELKCGQVLLHQLNRDVDRREDHRPVKSDLRGSGIIEEVADTIVFCYRPVYYATAADRTESAQWEQIARLRRMCKDDGADPRTSREGQRVEASVTYFEAIVAKARQGSTGTAKASFYRHLTRIVDRLELPE